MVRVVPAAPALDLDTASQAQDLDQLAGVAGGLETPAAPAGQAASNDLAARNSALLFDTARTVRDTVAGLADLKSPKLVATDEALRALADGWGAWCDRRGFDLIEMMGDHGDTIPLALSTAVLGWSVYSAARAELAHRRPVNAEAKPAHDTDTPTRPPAEQ